MATYTLDAGAVGTPTITTTANTIDTITYAQDMPLVELIHLSGTEPIWYTLDGSTPTIDGANCYILPPSSVDSREPSDFAAPTVLVKLISAGTTTLRIQRGT